MIIYIKALPHELSQNRGNVQKQTNFQWLTFHFAVSFYFLSWRVYGIYWCTTAWLLCCIVWRKALSLGKFLIIWGICCNLIYSRIFYLIVLFLSLKISHFWARRFSSLSVCIRGRRNNLTFWWQPFNQRRLESPKRLIQLSVSPVQHFTLFICW